ncbi:phenylacetone monooxygenase [Colletotrichum tofieldiae]|uniref:Phenylacetone monooxygenase n=1 Tax=Colletotrichum tofieldiae TaxID=708197 RepID=A0A166YQX5_9PEZI|nr:phenylacetone monooxygenase [Colletotrichum tofieldiae]GKT62824.1 phenylacetone monooxygenase [Colletotrichum tofieldiae]GKT69133.1 phenylacetone monooxygenase [Colletotrichum tofieldiae]
MSVANLRKIYDDERQKRLHPEGMDQYIDFRDPAIGGKLGQDPWVNYDEILANSTSLKDGSTIKFTIIGAGHAGLLYAVRLIDAGYKAEDIVLVDTAGGFGGTWYWNRYPGLMCDVEGYVYMPLLEETGYVPKNKYSYGAEIRGQCERIAVHYQLRGQFCTQVNHQLWDDTKRRWVIKMTQNRGPRNDPVQLTVETQFFISAAASLNVPHVPKLPGLRELMENKKLFHSARWDWQYTGGSQAQPNMIHLRGKKVGIIGTGATAIQIVPELAKWADHLYVFQRTPSYVGPRNQRETTPEEWKKVAYRQGWQYERQDNFNHFVSNDPVPDNLINDGWTAPDSHSVAGFIGSPSNLVTPDTVEEHIASMYKMDTARGDRLRAHIASVVKDEDTAKKLQPWYAGWCKRPAFHDDYLASFNLPNVTLVDTDGKGVDCFTASGVVANGNLYAIDVLVLATGFTAPGKNPSPSGHLNAPVIGRNGVDSIQKWGSQEYGTFYGTCSNGFPNAFFNGLAGGGVSYNLTSAYDVTAKFVANVIAVAHREAGSASKLLTIEASKEAEDRYTNEVQKRALWFSALATCTPGWFTGEADGALRKQTPEEQAARLRQVPWGSGILDFKRMVSEYISKQTLDGFELRT